MKKFIFTIAIAVIGINAATAQDITFGIKTGVSFMSAKATLSVPGFSTSATATETGYFVGGIADIAITDKFHIQPELTYLTDGDDYLNLPIMVKFYPVEKLSIQAGPQISYLFNAPEVIEDFNFAANFGVGYDITEQFFADARYSLGISDMDTVTFAETKLNMFQIGVGYKF